MTFSTPLARSSTLAALLFALQIAAGAQALPSLRPPAVPLVVHDPYFSIWSMSDQLNTARTEHWTGKPNRLTTYVRVDGTVYRLMGLYREKNNQTYSALPQTSVEVLPTRTIYKFAGAGLTIDMTFLTPALPDDLDVLARPLTYVEWTAAATDGRSHAVAMYLEAAADVVVNTPDEKVWAGRYLLDGSPVLKMGSRAQPMLEKAGDDLRIDWGYLYLAADHAENAMAAVMPHEEAIAAFEGSGKLRDTDEFSDSEPQLRESKTIEFSLDFGQVSTARSRYLMIAYDDLYSIEFFQRRERPWWRRNGEDAIGLLRSARREHDTLEARSQKFDEELMADLTKVGGEQYARLGALAYRQSLGAYKLVADVDGRPMFFPKENSSNGCIATVDVIYPAAPLALLFNPILLEAQLRPVLEYSQMKRWRWPFAPHDLGTYPLADGQVYGGGERTEENQMPVEESGNMLILLAALAKIEGNADFAKPYWPELTKWAEYLKEKGLDPENQLSTDDFAGHLAHNANLSIKAILALASYGRLAELTGHADVASEYTKLARSFAAKWKTMAREGDHYRLAFDQPNTWSQKYNLVWDQLLDLKIFPADVAQDEIKFYGTKENQYGLPLDNRRDYTKLDWIVWTAMLSDKLSDFQAIINPAYEFLQNSQSRVPMADWYDTKTAKKEGFQARSVVGGVFIKMLSDGAMWNKYAQRAEHHVAVSK